MDGGPITMRCTGAGTVWTEGLDDRRTDTCGQTFWHRTDETITASVDVVYDVRWTSAFGGGSLGTVVRSASFPFGVRGYQGVIR